MFSFMLCLVQVINREQVGAQGHLSQIKDFHSCTTGARFYLSMYCMNCKKINQEYMNCCNGSRPMENGCMNCHEMKRVPSVLRFSFFPFFDETFVCVQTLGHHLHFLINQNVWKAFECSLQIYTRVHTKLFVLLSIFNVVDIVACLSGEVTTYEFSHSAHFFYFLTCNFELLPLWKFQLLQAQERPMFRIQSGRFMTSQLCLGQELSQQNLLIFTARGTSGMHHNCKGMLHN